MARFLNTSATTFYMEELIKNARERLYIISPYLKINDRIKELLTDKDRMKIEVRLVFGKHDLAPQEINWLSSLTFLRTSFCQNLHAKCYLNEQEAIITSMNLYDFSQVNNNEMGILIQRESEPEVYKDTFEEAQRLFRIGEQVRLTAEKVEEPDKSASKDDDADDSNYDKLSTSRLAKQLGLPTAALQDKLLTQGLLKREKEQLWLTEAGKAAGGEFRYSKKFGPYFIWPKDLRA